VPTVILDGREASPLEYRELATAMRGLNGALVRTAKRGLDQPAAAVAPVTNRYEAIAAALDGPLALGIDYDNMSTLDWARQIDRDPGVFVLEGVGRFVEAFDDNLPIALESPVSRIRWDGAGVEVETARGTLAAKVVLVTVSTGVINGGELSFEPALPEAHRDAFARLPMGHLEKIVLAFEDGVLELPPNSWFLIQRGDEAPVELLVRPLGAPLAVAHVGGGLADALVRQGMDAVTDYAIEALAILFGSGIRAKVKRAFITEWSNDRYARGASAAALPGHAEARLALSEPVGDRLFFCGEANVPTWATQLAGAYISGLLTGERVAEMLRG
jgi:monoamine oxidase